MTEDWYLLVVRTAGLVGGLNLHQPYDFCDACPVCGAGARPTPPVRADLARMGKKALDATAHDGLLIVARELCAILTESRLTGFRAQPVEGRSPRARHEDFRWLEVLGRWPKLHRDSRLVTEDQCPECSRSGHFDVYPTGTRLVYDAPPSETPDFGLTWEYFGTWQIVVRAGHQPVGGHRRVIVSSRAKEVLEGLRRRHLDFDQVVIQPGAA